jgi:HAE1 family hydrophobic/amphiphilic exporter-1
MNFIRTAVHRPIGTLMAYAIVLLLGITSLLGLPLDLLPELSFPALSISVDYPGAGPEEVENLVTRIVEEAVSAAVGIEDVFSTSSEGNSRVTVSFPFGTNLDLAAADVRVALDRVRRRLPDAVETPVVFKFDPSQAPIMQLGLVSRNGNMGPADLQLLAEDQLQYRLERVPGAAAVTISGGVRREVHVDMDPVRMQALAVSEQDVNTALAGGNLVEPGGQVNEGTRRLGLRVLSEYRGTGPIARTVVAVRNGVPVYLGDLATVTEGEAERTSLVRVNGRPGVLMSVQRQSGANTVAVSDDLLREIRDVGPTLRGADVVVINDNARFIRRSLLSVQQALIIGGVLAIGVLLFFLRDWRSVLIIGTAIPTSILATFGLMFFSGFTLNLMTLGALAMGIGMLVDAAIVVLENVFRHREEEGKEGPEAAVAGTQEVWTAVLASTLTTVVVFLPVVFLRGSVITIQLFYQFSIVVVFALFGSIVVAMTLIPALAAHLPHLRQRPDHRRIDRMRSVYRGVLTWALGHRRTVFAVSAGVFLLGLASLYLIGRETIPQADEGELFASVALPVGTRLEVTNEVLSRFESVAREAVPEAEYITVTGGSTAFGGGTHRGNVRLRLKSKRSRTTEEVAADLRRRLQAPGARVNVRASSGALGFLRFGGSADPVEIEIRGFDLRRGMTFAQQVRETLEGIPGITDATVAREDQLPEVIVRIDGDKAAALGLTPPRISAALRTAISGGVATTLRSEGRETEIIVRNEAGAELTEAQVLTLPVITPTGRRVLLGQVATLTRGESPTQIARHSRQRIISVTAGIAGRDFGSVMADVRPRISALPLPDGFSLTYGQAYEEQQNAYRQLTFGFIVAVLLVYAVMAVQFEALLEPLLIMGSVPFALSGALLTLFLTGTTLNIQSLIGLIVLTGVIVNNAILLITFILERRRREGLSLHDAAVSGATLRLRPVLMTTATTMMGLLPTAIGIGEGAELQVPLARAVLGGLALGTLVTLVFIPTLYVSVEEFRARRRAPRPVEVPAGYPAPVAGAENGETRH